MTPWLVPSAAAALVFVGRLRESDEHPADAPCLWIYRVACPRVT